MGLKGKTWWPEAKFIVSMEIRFPHKTPPLALHACLQGFSVSTKRESSGMREREGQLTHLDQPANSYSQIYNPFTVFLIRFKNIMQKHFEHQHEWIG